MIKPSFSIIRTITLLGACLIASSVTAQVVPQNGNYGIYTETSTHKTAGEFAAGVNGDIFVWENTLTLETGEAREGSAAFILKSTGKGWYGMGLTVRAGFHVNLSAFDNANGKLHLSMKSTDLTDIRIGMKSGTSSGEDGQLWIDFKNGTDPYGFKRDGQWHDIEIPIADIKNTVNLSDVTQVLQVLGSAVTDLSIDDVYFSGGTTVQQQNAAPTAVIISSAMGATGPANIMFDGSKSRDSDGDTLTYSWDFGDGSTGTGATVNHSYAAEGSYHVILTVNDGNRSNSVKATTFIDKNFETVKSTKRGVSYGEHTAADMALMSKGLSWWYNWGITPEAAVAAVHKNFGMEYVPMTWNGDFDEAKLREYIAAHPEVKYLLAFNEPNFLEQANMTPSQVVAQWPRLEAIANDYNLKIVSVAMNYCGGCVVENGTTYNSPFDYFDDFFELCPSCRVDALAIHAYMPNVWAIKWYVGEFKKYGKPIWLTEFSAWESNTSPESQRRMLIQTIDYLENDKDVERYAWFIGRLDGAPYNGLLDFHQSGALTELGNTYINMPVHGDASTHTLPKLVQAENYATSAGIYVEPTEDASGFLDAMDADDVVEQWLEYNITSEATTYNLAMRVASTVDGAINILVDGVQVVSVDVTASGGVQTWKTVNSTIALPAGAHKVRLVFTKPMSINWMNFQKPAASSSAAASSSSAASSVASNSSSSGGGSIGWYSLLLLAGLVLTTTRKVAIKL